MAKHTKHEVRKVHESQLPKAQVMLLERLTGALCPSSKLTKHASTKHVTHCWQSTASATCQARWCVM
eukprot:1158225-Pelagomonas_calceolata.AAC.13